jgi:hypothetical protein
MTPRVLFIGGYGRCGSTLLDRIIGQTDGFFSAGEVRHLWQEGLEEDRRCGCGKRFSACPLWRRVMERAFPAGLDRSRLRQLRQRVDRPERIPQILAGQPASFRRDRDEYADILRRLYAAIHEVTSNRVIVDSSKDVSHGWLLTQAGIDLSVVHLVRDSRAAAYSWQRRKFNPGTDADMRRYRPLRAGLEWQSINALTHAQRHTRVPFLRLRYDDFAADPAASVDRVIALTGESARPVFDGPTIELAPNHMVAGNPNRFTAGAVTVAQDDEWRAHMRPASRLTVSALTWPGLYRYGFRRAVDAEAVAS